MKTRRILLLASVVVISFFAVESKGALASDDASAYGSWPGQNHGSGFDNWVFSNSSGNGSLDGEFLLTGNDSRSQINTGGNSWGLYANSSQTASAVRPFSSRATLGAGEQFLAKMDNGSIDTGGVVGLGFQNSAGANRLEFYFTGGALNYTLNIGGVTS